MVLVLLSKKRFRKQNSHIIRLAKDLNLPIHKGLSLKSHKGLAKWLKHPPIIEGNYQGKALKIFLFTRGTKSNSSIHSAIQILGNNPLGLSFTIVGHTWVQKIWQLIGTQLITFNDPVFDSQFIVKSNNPNAMQKILTNTLRSKFLALRRHHAYKGGIELRNDILIYVELHPIETDYKRKRFEALTDLMCCLRDEINIYSKEN